MAMVTMFEGLPARPMKSNLQRHLIPDNELLGTRTLTW
jgi:hypothetical protein